MITKYNFKEVEIINDDKDNKQKLGEYNQFYSGLKILQFVVSFFSVFLTFSALFITWYSIMNKQPYMSFYYVLMYAMLPFYLFISFCIAAVVFEQLPKFLIVNGFIGLFFKQTRSHIYLSAIFIFFGTILLYADYNVGLLSTNILAKVMYDKYDPGEPPEYDRVTATEPDINNVITRYNVDNAENAALIALNLDKKNAKDEILRLKKENNYLNNEWVLKKIRKKEIEIQKLELAYNKKIDALKNIKNKKIEEAYKAEQQVYKNKIDIHDKIQKEKVKVWEYKKQQYENKIYTYSGTGSWLSFLFTIGGAICCLAIEVLNKLVGINKFYLFMGISRLYFWYKKIIEIFNPSKARAENVTAVLSEAELAANNIYYSNKQLQNYFYKNNQLKVPIPEKKDNQDRVGVSEKKDNQDAVGVLEKKDNQDRVLLPGKNDNQDTMPNAVLQMVAVAKAQFSRIINGEGKITKDFMEKCKKINEIAKKHGLQIQLDKIHQNAIQDASIMTKEQFFDKYYGKTVSKAKKLV